MEVPYSKDYYTNRQEDQANVFRRVVGFSTMAITVAGVAGQYRRWNSNYAKEWMRKSGDAINAALFHPELFQGVPTSTMVDNAHSGVPNPRRPAFNVSGETKVYRDIMENEVLYDMKKGLHPVNIDNSLMKRLQTDAVRMTEKYESVAFGDKEHGRHVDKLRKYWKDTFKSVGLESEVTGERIKVFTKGGDTLFDALLPKIEADGTVMTGGKRWVPLAKYYASSYKPMAADRVLNVRRWDQELAYRFKEMISKAHGSGKLSGDLVNKFFWMASDQMKRLMMYQENQSIENIMRFQQAVYTPDLEELFAKNTRGKEGLLREKGEDITRINAMKSKYKTRSKMPVEERKYYDTLKARINTVETKLRQMSSQSFEPEVMKIIDLLKMGGVTFKNMENQDIGKFYLYQFDGVRKGKILFSKGLPMGYNLGATGTVKGPVVPLYSRPSYSKKTGAEAINQLQFERGLMTRAEVDMYEAAGVRLHGSPAEGMRKVLYMPSSAVANMPWATAEGGLVEVLPSGPYTRKDTYRKLPEIEGAELKTLNLHGEAGESIFIERKLETYGYKVGDGFKDVGGGVKELDIVPTSKARPIMEREAIGEMVTGIKIDTMQGLRENPKWKNKKGFKIKKGKRVGKGKYDFTIDLDLESGTKSKASKKDPIEILKKDVSMDALGKRNISDFVPTKIRQTLEGVDNKGNKIYSYSIVGEMIHSGLGTKVSKIKGVVHSVMNKQDLIEIFGGKGKSPVPLNKDFVNHLMDLSKGEGFYLAEAKQALKSGLTSTDFRKEFFNTVLNDALRHYGPDLENQKHQQLFKELVRKVYAKVFGANMSNKAEITLDPVNLRYGITIPEDTTKLNKAIDLSGTFKDKTLKTIKSMEQTISDFGKAIVGEDKGKAYKIIREYGAPTGKETVGGIYYGTYKDGKFETNMYAYDTTIQMLQQSPRELSAVAGFKDVGIGGAREGVVYTRYHQMTLQRHGLKSVGNLMESIQVMYQPFLKERVERHYNVMRAAFYGLPEETYMRDQTTLHIDKLKTKRLLNEQVVKDAVKSLSEEGRINALYEVLTEDQLEKIRRTDVIDTDYLKTAVLTGDQLEEYKELLNKKKYSMLNLKLKDIPGMEEGLNINLHGRRVNIKHLPLMSLWQDDVHTLTGVQVKGRGLEQLSIITNNVHRNTLEMMRLLHTASVEKRKDPNLVFRLTQLAERIFGDYYRYVGGKEGLLSYAQKVRMPGARNIVLSGSLLFEDSADEAFRAMIGQREAANINKWLLQPGTMAMDVKMFRKMAEGDKRIKIGGKEINTIVDEIMNARDKKPFYMLMSREPHVGEKQIQAVKLALFDTSQLDRPEGYSKQKWESFKEKFSKKIFANTATLKALAGDTDRDIVMAVIASLDRFGYLKNRVPGAKDATHEAFMAYLKPLIDYSQVKGTASDEIKAVLGGSKGREMGYTAYQVEKIMSEINWSGIGVSKKDVETALKKSKKPISKLVEDHLSHYVDGWDSLPQADRNQHVKKWLKKYGEGAGITIDFEQLSKYQVVTNMDLDTLAVEKRKLFLKDAHKAAQKLQNENFMSVLASIGEDVAGMGEKDLKELQMHLKGVEKEELAYLRSRGMNKKQLESEMISYFKDLYNKDVFHMETLGTKLGTPSVWKRAHIYWKLGEDLWENKQYAGLFHDWLDNQLQQHVISLKHRIPYAATDMLRTLDKIERLDFDKWKKDKAYRARYDRYISKMMEGDFLGFITNEDEIKHLQNLGFMPKQRGPTPYVRLKKYGNYLALKKEVLESVSEEWSGLSKLTSSERVKSITSTETRDAIAKRAADRYINNNLGTQIGRGEAENFIKKQMLNLETDAFEKTFKLFEQEKIRVNQALDKIFNNAVDRTGYNLTKTQSALPHLDKFVTDLIKIGKVRDDYMPIHQFYEGFEAPSIFGSAKEGLSVLERLMGDGTADPLMGNIVEGFTPEERITKNQFNQGRTQPLRFSDNTNSILFPKTPDTSRGFMRRPSLFEGISETLGKIGKKGIDMTREEASKRGLGMLKAFGIGAVAAGMVTTLVTGRSGPNIGPMPGRGGEYWEHTENKIHERDYVMEKLEAEKKTSRIFKILPTFAKNIRIKKDDPVHLDFIEQYNKERQQYWNKFLEPNFAVSPNVTYGSVIRY